MKKPPFVAARLRLRRDADIIEALEGIESGDVSCLVREGLRRVLNISKQPEPKLQREVKLVEQLAESEVVVRQIVKQPAESVPEQQKNQPEKLVWKL